MPQQVVQYRRGVDKVTMSLVGSGHEYHKITRDLIRLYLKI